MDLASGAIEGDHSGAGRAHRMNHDHSGLTSTFMATRASGGLSCHPKPVTTGRGPNSPETGSARPACQPSCRTARPPVRQSGPQAAARLVASRAPIPGFAFWQEGGEDKPSRATLLAVTSGEHTRASSRFGPLPRSPGHVGVCASWSQCGTQIWSLGVPSSKPKASTRRWVCDFRSSVMRCGRSTSSFSTSRTWSFSPIR